MSMKGNKYGTHRVIEPKGVLTQAAWKVDNDMTKLYSNEIICNVTSLNVDSASFTQIEEACGGDEQKIGEMIMGIVAERGKQQNPVTGSGGMFKGEVAYIGEDLLAKPGFDLKVGDKIVSLVSLSMTPLKIDKILAVHKDILGFDVAVNDSLIMRVLESAKNLNSEMDRFFPAENFLLFDIFFKGDAVDMLHYDILYVLIEADVIYFYDIRMGKNSDCFGFVAETAKKFVIFHVFVTENFYRNSTVINAVISFIYIRHAANADNFFYLIAAVEFFSYISVHQEPPDLFCDADNCDVIRAALFFGGIYKFIDAF